MGLLTNKVAIVTGGTRGIGKGIVTKFVAEGAKVVFTYRSSDAEANAIVAEIGEDKVLAIKSDASKMDQAQALIQSTLDHYGQIDILVNNAGITRDNLMLRMTEEQWDEVIDINLKSVFALTKSVIRPMLKQRSGSIINMSSVVGVFGNAGQANYAASKAGILGFTKSIAKELGSRNIRCNAITPGFIKTEMTEELDEKTKENYVANIPLNDFGTVEDIAEACLFLAGDASRYITGQVLSVCGGMNI
jgi:3-oxoacyl-[acyl-carrier protein] reductase